MRPSFAIVIQKLFHKQYETKLIRIITVNDLYCVICIDIYLCAADTKIDFSISANILLKFTRL